MSPSTSVHEGIDRTYARFVRELPEDLVAVAHDLPHRLGLTPNPGTPWSRVFNNPAVLGLPMLLLADRARVSDELRSVAGAAHLFAIIVAFGMDRIDDGQVVVGLRERAILERLERARDAALAALLADTPSFLRDFAWARRMTAESVAEERATAAGRAPATLERYLAVAWKKQGFAFPAALAAAAAAGFSAAEQSLVEAVVAGAALGLQYRDDVVDWEDDLAQGFAWAPALFAPPPAEPAGLAPVAARLHLGGGLVRLLGMASAAFGSAANAAAALGAEALAAWAREQAELTADLARREAASPGHAVSWERERKARRERQQTLAAVAAA
ncbi:hypothetical protein [Nannocystis punicea]|uniref:Uncharacterized protein n=1 Tax=Nannocystis punicea TaxID=2995304 RepID=A0ABY7H966_9BACT|nr:hypothetical protein [Nannocystis poenicansa]WAS95529.1 hypothetical protein O0S08_05150 [Nannocystis poenicansa]